MSWKVFGAVLGTVCGGFYWFQHKQRFSKIETPIQEIEYSPYFKTYYSRAKKIPLAVEEVITKDNLKGTASRKKAKFIGDKKVLKKYRSTLQDYYGTYGLMGLNRGHMAMSSNYKNNQQGMNKTFKLSNIVPQDGENNGNLWNSFEMLCKTLTGKYEKVRIISGPLFLPKDVEFKRKYGVFPKKIGEIKFATIGEGDVHVPTHLYKIISCENRGKKPHLACFVMPNSPLKEDSSKIKFKDFQVTLEELEKMSGLGFKGLKKKKFKDLVENNSIVNDMTKKEYDMMSVNERVQGCKKFEDYVYNEGFMQRKQLTLKDFPHLSDKITSGFKEVLEKVLEEKDHCKRCIDLMKISKILFQSSYKETNKDYKDQILKLFMNSLKMCKEKQTRSTLKKFFRYGARNSVLNEVKEEAKKNIEA